ncbi:MAG: hypothetical protein IID51_05860 [Proteobacteria bacterium]|nr:hypothetical protein [Pseudomonadota bacterium]
MGLRLVVLRSRHSIAGCLALVVCASLSIVGCGRAKYEARQKETIKYFAYREKLNLNLAAEWTGQGIRIRVPKQFQLMPGPANRLKVRNQPTRNQPTRVSRNSSTTFYLGLWRRGR